MNLLNMQSSPVSCHFFLLRTKYYPQHLSSPSVRVLKFMLQNRKIGKNRPALGSTQPPIQWAPGALPLEVKPPERKGDHSPPSIAEVKNVWSYTRTPPISLHGVVLSLAEGLYLYLYLYQSVNQSDSLGTVEKHEIFCLGYGSRNSIRRPPSAGKMLFA